MANFYTVNITGGHLVPMLIGEMTEILPTGKSGSTSYFEWRSITHSDDILIFRGPDGTEVPSTMSDEDWKFFVLFLRSFYYGPCRSADDLEVLADISRISAMGPSRNGVIPLLKSIRQVLVGAWHRWRTT